MRVSRVSFRFKNSDSEFWSIRKVTESHQQPEDEQTQQHTAAPELETLLKE